mmetsp:Transcript_29758/g.64846  ORF Transcript_29758/g.64846 Transcript_29758/m.64846 type:complete len:437 (+) Transcript_29758:79-1389(+)
MQLWELLLVVALNCWPVVQASRPLQPRQQQQQPLRRAGVGAANISTSGNSTEGAVVLRAAHGNQSSILSAPCEGRPRPQPQSDLAGAELGSAMVGLVDQVQDLRKAKRELAERDASVRELQRTLAEMQGKLQSALQRASDSERQYAAESQMVATLQSDKEALLRALRGAMRTNQTQMLQDQIDDLAREKAMVEEQCAREHAALQASAAHTRGSDGQAKELVQTLQEESLSLMRKGESLRSEVVQLKRELKDAQTDKQHLLDTVRSITHENAQHKTLIASATKQNSDCRAEIASLQQQLAPKNRQSSSTGAALGPPQQQRVRNKVIHEEAQDPLAYMGETSSITAYISHAALRSAASAASAALHASGSTGGALDSQVVDDSESPLDALLPMESPPSAATDEREVESPDVAAVGAVDAPSEAETSRLLSRARAALKAS